MRPIAQSQGPRTATLLSMVISHQQFVATATRLAQPRMPRVPEGVLTLTSPLFCDPVTNRKAPREASTATLPLPLFGSYANLSSRTFDPGPTVRLLLSRKRRSAWPLLPVRID